MYSYQDVFIIAAYFAIVIVGGLLLALLLKFLISLLI